MSMIDTDECPYCYQHTLNVSTFEEHFHFVECDHCGARGPRVLISEVPYIGLNAVPCQEKSALKGEPVENSSDLLAKNKSLEQLVNERTQALERANSELRQLVYVDPLTGVGNRLMLDAWLRGKDPNVTITVMMIDLDHFKLINDRFGHRMGDEALAAVAKCLSHNIRKDDVLIRWGGEEFLLLLNNAEVDQACRIAENLRQKIELIGVLPANEKMTISIGLSVCHVKRFDHAMAAADEALYQAKKAGRNRITVLADMLKVNSG